ncbi:MAG: DNA-directed RNA polymerase subunit D [Promethearchaeota archaeon]
MEIEILDENPNFLKFILKDSSPAFVNALRRIMLNDVPCMAIDEIMILDNTTPLYDETLAHRLGLSPLKTDLESYILPSECSCGGVGCTSCEVSFTMEKEAKEELDVLYSGDLKSQDPKIVPVSPKIPLLKMAKGQQVLLQAIARLGTGKQHAKWQPVATASYKYYPIVTIDQEACTACEECVEICPRNVFKASNNKKEKIILTDVLNCMFCEQCIENCPENAITVTDNARDFIFQLESTGTLPARQILIESLKILQSKAQELYHKIVALEVE